MAADTPKNGYAYLAARARIASQILQLAKGKGIGVRIEVDSGRGSSEVVNHQIQLSNGRSTRVMAVDHETFMDEEFFRTLVLHQIEAAIDGLAASG